MYLAKVTFGKCPQTLNKDAAEDLIHGYLAALMKTGQLCGRYLLAWHKSQLVGYAHLARPNAMMKRFHSKWGKADMARIIESFQREPMWEMIDDNIPKRFPSWKSASALYLFTHAFDDSSAICRMDDGTPIPAYLVPISSVDRQDLYFWIHSYQEHYRIWLGSTALEMPAYKELADPHSEMTSSGREICRKIEEATAKPTYYYLKRYYGRRTGETNRLCPGCGKKWFEKKTGDTDSRIFHNFDFRCDSCRLVSHMAIDFEDERHACIGEFRHKRKYVGAGQFMERGHPARSY